MTSLEKFEELVKEGHKTTCPCCGCQTTYSKVQESTRTMTVYGMTFKEIREMWEFARQHGYKPQS